MRLAASWSTKTSSICRATPLVGVVVFPNTAEKGRGTIRGTRFAVETLERELVKSRLDENDVRDLS